MYVRVCVRVRSVWSHLAREHPPYPMAMCYPATLVLLLLNLVTGTDSLTAEYSHTIYVDRDSGTNSTACWTDNSPNLPCRNLSYALEYRNHSTQYLLQPGTHYLNSIASDHPFTDLQGVAIAGMGNGSEVTKVICFTPNAGLAFINVTNVAFENVTFSNCASLQNSTSRDYSSSEFELSLTQVGLYFSLCAGVSMERVHIQNSPRGSGIIIYNTIGTNSFSNCNFSNNSNPSPVASPGGGGVYIEFSYCLPGNTSCENGTEESYTDHNHGATYNFISCTFRENEAHNLNETNSSFIVPHHEEHVSFSRGGGLSIFFNADSWNNTVTIFGCNFLNNTADWGAGMFVEFHDTSNANNVSIIRTFFKENICTGVAGGGLRIAHFVFATGNSSNGRNQIEVDTCSFTGNTADNGGGVSIYPARQVGHGDELVSIAITSSRFQENRAKYGAALNIELFKLILDGDKPTITVLDGNFYDNSVYPLSYSGPHEVGIGAVYIDEVDVNFHGYTWFVINNGSALAVVGSKVNFSDASVDFFNNQGMNGGAIALLGLSKIIINQRTSFLFKGNIASEHGGAIYNKYTIQNNFRNISNCFIAHRDASLPPDKWGASFTFSNNRDSSGTIPNAIYSTSILPCAITSGTGEERVDDIFCWPTWKFDSGNCHDFIRTGPGQIFIQRPNFRLNSSSIPTIDIDLKSSVPIVSAYPGELLKLPIHAEDDLNHTISLVYIATPGINYTSSEYAKINSTYLSNGIIQVYGNASQMLPLHLYSTGDRVWHVEMTVILQECPPGLVNVESKLDCRSTEKEDSTTDSFSFDDTNTTQQRCRSCECSQESSYGDVVRCDSLSDASLISGYWMGTHTQNCTEECLAIAECPPGFCRTPKNDHEFLKLPSSIDDLQNSICAKHREGRLCGLCAKHYGPAVNSKTYECVHCNDTNIAAHATYYILSVYVPLFVLFLIIIVFNVKLTTGPANAFILYSQVISSTFDLSANGHIKLKQFDHYLLAYRFPYGIFNLKFFEQFISPHYLCFGTSLNALDLLLLQYAVAFFPLFMILAIVLYFKIQDCFQQKFHCHSRPVSQRPPKWYRPRVGEALIPAFATFILLSYNKFSLVSSYISKSATFLDSNGHPISDDSKRAYFAGHYSVTDPTYVHFYFLPAIVILLTFVAIPPLILLDYPLRVFEKLLRKFPRVWRYYPNDKMHIILDAFQGCYKNKCRYFAGLYFIFRLLINVTYIYSTPLLQFTFQEVFCVVFALLVAFLKPYKLEYHIFNYIDSFMFLNLAVINQISLYIYAYTRIGSNPPNFKLTFAVQYILVFLPLVYMIAYIVWSLMPLPKLRSRGREWLRQKQHQRYQTLFQQSSAANSDQNDDVDWERAHDINNYNPSTRVTATTEKSQTDSEDSSRTNLFTGENGTKSYESTNSSTCGIETFESLPVSAD